MTSATPRWIWVRPEARHALASGDVGVMLACYRKMTGLSQVALAHKLGFDPSYISLLERGRRTITDRSGLGYLSRELAIPPHALGIATDDDADFQAALHFGSSTVRLAEIARQAGRAHEAVDELWPLITRLEARLVEGSVDAPTIALLARARIAFAISLGHVLAEEQLFVAARWSGRALILARHLQDEPLLAHVLRMHGNELRKAGRTAAAVARLSQSVELEPVPALRGQASLLLARSAGERGDGALFDDALERAERTFDESGGGSGILLSPFTLREARMRGLTATGRARQAAVLVQQTITPPPAPQWHAIERVTTAGVLLAAGDTTSSLQAATEALDVASRHSLPHQIQRLLRLVPYEQRQLRERAAAALADVRKSSAQEPHLRTSPAFCAADRLGH